MTDAIRISALKAGRALALGTVGIAAMAMAPAPALANASASASADVKAPVRENAEKAESDAKFKQLFATWKKTEAEEAKVGIANTVTSSVASIPSRLPVEGSRYSSSFGSRIHPVTGRRKNHNGLDMAAPTGTPIYATADGRVEMAQWYGGYGNYVQIEHGGDIETRYGHMSRLNVRPDQEVKKGELIGWVGSTGRSTGPHLHYEVRIAGAPVDPEPYLNRDTFQQAFAEANGLGAGGPED
ncbi:M23 family metallopeptidase [Croceicoccus gelatinilyticus]|uniref:M23 family metallopeptidase n=1 Tax=Croceicoccus gelatinilyticus TaxID=2835536 RepID=UPI001BCEE1A0|nr:M23 family metallopeptidase [Croceicoccus gelatinilyticus]MBS7669649.1 M23 family metallopeptidase [Croceicoccus gelatinilyticus]